MRVAMLQEMKLKGLNDRLIREIRKMKNISWVAVGAVGSSGGIHTMWDTRYVVVEQHWTDAFSVSIIVEDLSARSKWLLTAVYGPDDGQRRKELWKELNEVRGCWNGAWCIGGDWNIIRFPSERLEGCRWNEDMRAFSDWINHHSLMDLHLACASFTWSNHQSAPIM